MIACDPKYLHQPKVPEEYTFWPFNSPIIMTELERRGLEVNTTGQLDGMQAQIDDLLVRLREAINAFP